MLKKSLRPFIWLLVFMVVIGLACSMPGASDPTAVPKPAESKASSTPLPTATDVPPTATNPPPTATNSPPTATTAPANTPVPTVAPPPTKEVVAPPQPVVQLEPNAYIHSDQLIEVNPPLGWEVDEGVAAVYLYDPENIGFIQIQATNVGYAFLGVDLANFMSARESNLFSIYPEYVEVSHEVNTQEGYGTVVKTLTADGIPQTMLTLYSQLGQVVFSLDFWADSNSFDDYADLYDAVIDTIYLNSDIGIALPIYSWVLNFDGPGNLFSIQVPTEWRFEETMGEDVIVDTFYSPDEHGVIQNITYDDGTLITKSMAGEFALALLRTYYAEDIKITSDEVMPDGSERLIWNSPGGDYTGASFFETRGTTFLLFTLMYDNPYEDVYLDALLYTIETYTIP